jgi:pilus assembly protein CpaB
MNTESIFGNKRVLQLIMSALLAFFIVHYFVEGELTKKLGVYQMVDVIVSSRDIPPRTILSAGDLSIKPVPRQYVEPGAVVAKVPGGGRDLLLGKKTLTALPVGAQIPISALTDPSMKDIDEIIPPGKLAFILRLGNLDVSNIINPGHHVDVLATISVRQSDGSTHRIVKTILRNVLILSAGREVYNPNVGIPSNREPSETLVLTLAVSSFEAERLQLAQAVSQGEINVILRRHADDDLSPIQPATETNILQ